MVITIINNYDNNIYVLSCYASYGDREPIVMNIPFITVTFNKQLRRVKSISNQSNYNGHSATLNIHFYCEFHTIQCIFVKILFNDPQKSDNLDVSNTFIYENDNMIRIRSKLYR